MAKPKVKVKEIKKKVKVTEVNPDKSKENSLEEKIDDSSNVSPMFSRSKSSAPVIRQESIPQFSQATRTQVREGLKEKDREFSYQAMTPSGKSYDPSIKSSSNFFESSSSGQRINPSIRSSPVQGDSSFVQNSGRVVDNLDQSGTEPGLRRFKDDEKDYSTERIEKYIPKRRSVN